MTAKGHGDHRQARTFAPAQILPSPGSSASVGEAIRSVARQIACRCMRRHHARHIAGRARCAGDAIGARARCADVSAPERRAVALEFGSEPVLGRHERLHDPSHRTGRVSHRRRQQRHRLSARVRGNRLALRRRHPAVSLEPRYVLVGRRSSRDGFTQESAPIEHRCPGVVRRQVTHKPPGQLHEDDQPRLLRPR